MTAIPPTATPSSFAGTSRSNGSPGVRVAVALGLVALAVVSWSAARGHLAVEIPASLVVFLVMALVALGGAVALHKLQTRSGPGHRSAV